MYFLWIKVEKQFQLCLELLGPNDVVLNNNNMPVTVKHVENVSPNLRVYL